MNSFKRFGEFPIKLPIIIYILEYYAVCVLIMPCTDSGFTML